MPSSRLSPTNGRGVWDQTARVANWLWERGWAEANAGNLSVRVTQGVGSRRFRAQEELALRASYPHLAEEVFLVTATRQRMRDVAESPHEHSCLIKIDKRGRGYALAGAGATGGLRPTSELLSHLALHNELVGNKRPEQSIIHTHPSELVALSLHPTLRDEAQLNDLLWRLHPEVVVLVPRGMGVVPYVCPGTQALAEATVAKLKHHDVVLWEKHGVVAIGRDLFEAFDRIDTINKAARIALLCLHAGFEPHRLTHAQIRDLRQAFSARVG